MKKTVLDCKFFLPSRRHVHFTLPDIQEDTLDTFIATTEATGEDGLAEVFEDSNAPQAAAVSKSGFSL